jgi:hypothetical protein
MVVYHVPMSRVVESKMHHFAFGRTKGELPELEIIARFTGTT